MASDGTHFCIHDAIEFIFNTLHYFCFFLVKLLTNVIIQFYHSHEWTNKLKLKKSLMWCTMVNFRELQKRSSYLFILLTYLHVNSILQDYSAYSHWLRSSANMTSFSVAYCTGTPPNSLATTPVNHCCGQCQQNCWCFICFIFFICFIWWVNRSWMCINSFLCDMLRLLLVAMIYIYATVGIIRINQFLSRLLI